MKRDMRPTFYEGVKFRAAIRAFKKARRKARDPRVKGKAHLYLGMALAVKKKQRRKAEKEFKKALKLDPTLVLASGDAKAAIMELFEKVRQGMIGTLEVRSTPPGAAVLLDGKPAGKTPYSGKLPVGKHTVVLQSADGLDRHQAEVVVAVGQSHTVEGKLAFVGARVNITTTPPGASVLLDGKQIGTTPLSGTRVAAGAHEVRLELAGHQAKQRKLQLKAGGSSSLELALAPLVARPRPVKPVTPAPAKPDPKQQPVVVPSSQPVDGQSDGRKVPVWTIVAGSVALAALGAGIGMGLASDSAHEEYEDPKTKPDRANELREQILDLETGANASFITAGVAAAAAVVLFLVVDRPAMKAANKEAKAALRVSPGGLGVSWQW